MSRLFVGQRQCLPCGQAIHDILMIAVIVQFGFTAQLLHGIHMQLCLASIVEVDRLRFLQSIGDRWWVADGRSLSKQRRAAEA